MSKKLIEETVKKRVKGEARKKVQRSATLNENGAEVLDEQPLFHDMGFKPKETLNDKIRRITAQVQAETVAKLQAQNLSDEDIERILDEEDDFDLPDEYDTTLTQYEAAGRVSELEEQIASITPAEQSGSAANGGEATAKPEDVPVPPVTESDNTEDSSSAK